jgi:RNA polymerase sigma-B factor
MLEDAGRRDRLDLELLRRYHEDHDLQARDEMVRRGLPLVRALARRYGGRGESLEDLVQVGCVGLVKAIDRFDASAGTRFATFAAPNITGEIKRYFRDHCWAVHVPRSVQELDARITRAKGELSARTGREPTVEELAEHLEEPVERVADAVVGSRGYRTVSLDHPTGDAREALDLFGAPDRQFAQVEQRGLIQQACEVLDERQKEVVLLRFYDGRLQREIAERIGVSQMQVSRIISDALEKMRAHLGDDRESALAADELVAA